MLQAQGWLEAAELTPEASLRADAVDFSAMVPFRMDRLARAATRFANEVGAAQREDFVQFCADPTYTPLFMESLIAGKLPAWLERVEGTFPEGVIFLKVKGRP